MGDWGIIQNIVFFRKYRNRHHVWFEAGHDDFYDFLNLFKTNYSDFEEGIPEVQKPVKLITWEE